MDDSEENRRTSEGPSVSRIELACSSTLPELHLGTINAFDALIFNFTRSAERSALAGWRDLPWMTGGAGIDSSRVREYFDRWVQAKGGSISAATKGAYESATKDFCEFLGDHAGHQMLYLTKADIAAFRDRFAAAHATTTANNRLKS